MELLGRQRYPLVCLPCRKTVKRHYLEMPVSCPHCGKAMLNFGKKFKVPPRHDEKSWKKVEWMVANGWDGYNWPSTPKMSAWAMREALAEEQQRSALWQRKMATEASLRNIKKRARYSFRKRKNAKKRLTADAKAQEKYQAKIMAETQHLREK